MKAEKLSREELLDRLENGIDSMKKRFNEIENSDYRLKSDATSRFNKIIKDIPDDLNKLNNTELRNLYRDLIYVNSLKTSTLEGAHQASVMYADIEQMIDSLSPNIKEKFWELYGKLYDANELAGSQMYKYDILREIATEIYKSKSKYKTIEDLEENLLKITELISGERYINIHEELEKLKNQQYITISSNDIRTEPFKWDF